MISFKFLLIDEKLRRGPFVATGMRHTSSEMIYPTDKVKPIRFKKFRHFNISVIVCDYLG